MIGQVNDASVAVAGGLIGGLKGTALAFDASAFTDYDNSDSCSTNAQTLTHSCNFGGGTTGTR